MYYWAPPRSHVKGMVVQTPACFLSQPPLLKQSSLSLNGFLFRIFYVILGHSNVVMTVSWIRWRDWLAVCILADDVGGHGY